MPAAAPGSRGHGGGPGPGVPESHGKKTRDCRGCGVARGDPLLCRFHGRIGQRRRHGFSGFGSSRSSVGGSVAGPGSVRSYGPTRSLAILMVKLKGFPTVCGLKLKGFPTVCGLRLSAVSYSGGTVIVTVTSPSRYWVGL